MQAPLGLVRLVRWRWTPSVVLVAGSLAFVGVVVLIVPDDLGSVASGTERLSRATRGRVAKDVGSTTEQPPLPTYEEHQAAPVDEPGSTGISSRGSNIVQSIFHPTPKMELPVEPVDPNPPPPPPPPPLPPPTQTIYTLENPPPPPPHPNPLANPEPAPPAGAVPAAEPPAQPNPEPAPAPAPT